MNDAIAGPGFSNVDRSANPEPFVNYLDCVGAESVMQWLERQILSRLQVELEGRFLDVGCGKGDDVRAMAAMVGPDGWVVGIDSSEIMIAEAETALGRAVAAS